MWRLFVCLLLVVVVVVVVDVLGVVGVVGVVVMVVVVLVVVGDVIVNGVACVVFVGVVGSSWHCAASSQLNMFEFDCQVDITSIVES